MKFSYKMNCPKCDGEIEFMVKDIVEKMDEITPEKFSSYLIEKGWRKTGGGWQIFNIWHRDELENKDFEIVQPEARDLKDFRQGMYAAIAVLIDFEERSGYAIIDDIHKIEEKSLGDILREELNEPMR